MKNYCLQEKESKSPRHFPKDLGIYIRDAAYLKKKKVIRGRDYIISLS